MTYESTYKIGQIVYLRTDRDQNEHIVTHVHFDCNGAYYTISHNGMDSCVYDIQISRVRNKLKELGIDNAST